MAHRGTEFLIHLSVSSFNLANSSVDTRDHFLLLFMVSVISVLKAPPSLFLLQKGRNAYALYRFGRADILCSRT